MSSKPVFLYFDGTGRVLPARIALFAAFGKDGWVNETMDFASFGEEKKKLAAGAPDARLVSGSLPQLTLPSGKTYCQTLSISRWACCWAHQNGVDIKNLYPIKNPDHFIAMDEAMTFAMEILDRCPHDADPEGKKKKREEYAAETGFMGRVMRILENRLAESPGDFLLGSEPCLADFTMHTLNLMITSGQFDYVPKTYVEKYPCLAKQMEAVQNCTWMTEYIKAYGKQP